MSIRRNTAGQKVAVYAHNTLTDLPATGDAANITGRISKDGGAPAATVDVNPSELDVTHQPGTYVFDLDVGETDCGLLILAAASTTPNVVLRPVIVYTSLSGAEFLRGAEQKVAVYAHDAVADAPKTADAANITARIAKDGGISNLTTDTNPDELSAAYMPGIYLFTLSAIETTADMLVVRASSSTANVVIRPVVLYPDTSTSSGTAAPSVGPASYLHGLKRGAGTTVCVALIDAATGRLKTSPTLAAGDFRISKDGGALADLTLLPEESPAGSGMVLITLTDAEMTANTVAIRWRDQAGAEWLDGTLVLITRTVTVDELVRATTPANALDVSSTGEVGLDFSNVKGPDTETSLPNVVIDRVGSVDEVVLLGEEAIVAASFAADAIGSDAVADGAVSKIWAALTSGMATEGSIGKAVKDNLDTLLARLGAFTGTGVRTVKGYLEAMARSGVSAPSDFGTFDPATQSLQQIGLQATGIGYTSGTKAIDRLATLESQSSSMAEDVWSAVVTYYVDSVESQDEFTALIYRNGQYYNPSNLNIILHSRATGTQLGLGLMTKIGTTPAWRYNATGAARAAAGDSYIVTLGFLHEGNAKAVVAIPRGRDR